MSAAAALPADLDLIVRGGGWGHGHGMSQYGARAQAAAGRTWRTILGSYYSGVSITDEGPQTIRVLLASAGSIVVGGPERVTAKWVGGDAVTANSDAYPFLRARAVTDGVAVDKGESATGPWRAVATGSRNVRFFPDNTVVAWATGGQLRYYRGLIEANRRSSSTLYAINQLSLEQYLRGVVPRESPASWPIDALRAQAVAARSYTLWKKANNGSSVYHICATTACQVYGGYGYRNSFDGPMTVLEHPNTNTAIADTAEQAMTVNGDAIFAEYHSSSGGHTSQGSRSYLAPREDPWDATYSPYNRWTDQVSVAEIERRWPAIGRMSAITSVARDGDGPWGGRVTSMKIVGTDGSVTVSGDTFRISFGLRSTLFTIDVYDADVVSAPAEVLLAPGETERVTVVLKNTGNRSWPVRDDVKLVTWDPKDRDTAFDDDTWASATRPTAIDTDLSDEGGNSVAPGQSAGFTFTLRAPSSLSSGSYLERFRPIAQGLTVFGPAFTIPVRVVFDGASHLGANLVANPSLEAPDASIPDGWRAVNGGDSDVRTEATAVDGSASLRLQGSPAERKGFTQRIQRSGKAGDRFVLSGWNRARDVSATGGSIDLMAKLRHADGSDTSVRVDFPVTTHGWRYEQTTFTAPEDFTAIDLYAHMRYQTGWTWYDRIRLVREDLMNAGFEAGAVTPSSWELLNGPSGSGRDTVSVRSGIASLRLNGSTARNVYARQYRSIAGAAGQTLRLSGWNRTTGSSASGGAVQLWMRVRHTDGTSATAAYDFPRAPHAWRYGELLVTTQKAYDRVDVFARFAEQTGSAWFDELNLAPATGGSTLSANAGFELGDPLPGEWELVNAASSASVASTAAAGEAALALQGDAGVNRYARQYLPVAGDAGDSYALSGWNKTLGSDPDGGVVRIWARFRYTDGTSGETVLEFGRGVHDWASRSATMTAAKPYTRIDVFTRFDDQSGSALFDNVRVRPVA